ncbi:hypothetical protein G4B88_002761 [Cannabis sativa]|uniref:CCHC-type domain-containing protein n=1 Tax=Cannabis sativa TaxID=3483 RepID=A0A7J6HHY1_CANSA|nr:hypothetical protein G4B88_002761 [Cannabis sativa]
MLEKPQHMEQSDITMEDLLARTTNLTVLEDEGWEVNGDGDSEVASLCAMGRWCSTRPISRSLLKTILGRVWGISERNWSVEIKHTTKSASFLVFSFKSSQDLNRILIKNPWFLNNGILILEKFEGIPNDWEKVLTEFPLSGRILNLPIRSITQGNMDRLAGFAGQIIHVQKADAPKIAAKGYFTFKVRHDIAKPIFPGFLFPCEGRKVWLPYRYDRLPFMCFNCGFVGHDTRICAETIKIFEDATGMQQQGYGSWLKVNDKQEFSTSFIQDPCGNTTQLKAPPGFTDKRPTSSTMQPMNHVLNASGNPSIDFNASTTMMPRVSAPISLNKAAGKVGKGKEIEKEHNLKLTPTAMEAPNHILNSGVGLVMGKMNAGQGSSKRDGSWREESCAELIGELTQHQSNYTPHTQQNLRNNNMEDMPILIDIPISYDNSFASLNKGEGSSKRRKVIPKRSKIKGGTGSKEVMMENVNETDDTPWVLGIIPSMHQPDWITWDLTNNGNYSVASGYKLRFSNPDWAACSNNSKLKAWWKFIWGSKLTPKMKNFIWKVFNHWIPTKVELRKRGMSLDANCDWCLQQEEDICHALWCCPKVQKLWKQLGYSKFKDQNTHNASNFLWWQWEHLTKEEFFRFVGFSWLIWQRRNNYIFQHKVSDNKYWIPWALETIEQHLGMKHQPTVAHTPSASTTWQPPPKDLVIINTDASLVHGQEGCGLSAVIRDDKGSLIVAETMFIAGCLSVKLAEAAAIHLGLRLAERWSISKAWVASDSKVLITAIENGDSFPTDWGQLVQNINQMKSHFQLLHFLFYSRNCNKVANSLAKRSRMTQKSETWTDCLPYCAAACLIADMPSAA